MEEKKQYSSPKTKQSIEELKQQVRSGKGSQPYKVHNSFKELWDLPWAKPVIISGGIYIFLFAGKYVLRELAGFIDSVKRLKKTIKS